ncbi:DUF2802 domain-containing protein [Alteromonas sp. a30]|uniref:DUF2802 domain-containing protein n=1 Tax=Alteromonas sp. a30 TaxID=2730917 RepID=UPI0022816C85|nr:DUF2802 domain-containing protein [Alteromonas sp. a30]MCY7294408.1 DUF2802 domain-containing protein [Alteromonas sp. a30]
MQYISLVVAGIAIILALFLFRLLQKKQQHILTLIQALEGKRQSTDRAHQKLDEMLHEVRTGAIGIGSKLKAVEAELKALKQQQIELSNKQADLAHQEVSSPMYTRAAKLVASGASIDDIMEECDLPRAEAELLISLHRK